MSVDRYRGKKISSIQQTMWPVERGHTHIHTNIHTAKKLRKVRTCIKYILYCISIDADHWKLQWKYTFMTRASKVTGSMATDQTYNWNPSMQTQFGTRSPESILISLKMSSIISQGALLACGAWIVITDVCFSSWRWS